MSDTIEGKDITFHRKGTFEIQPNADYLITDWETGYITIKLRGGKPLHNEEIINNPRFKWWAQIFP